MSGVPYHAWTHRPKLQGGTDPIESSTDIPWARRSRPFTAGTQTITSGGFVDIVMTEEWNMGAGESGEDWFQPETSGATPYGIEVLQNSFLAITASVYWDNIVNATWFIWVTHGGGGAWIYYPQFAGQNVTTEAGTFDFHRRCETGTIIEMGLFHTAGSNRLLDSAFLEVAVLGTWTGTSPQDMTTLT